MKRFTILLLAAVALFSCRQTAQEVQQEQATSAPEEVVAAQQVEQAEEIPVTTDVRMNGKVIASRYADLAFRQALPVSRVLVHNGQRVRRGDVIASLEVFTLDNAIQQQVLAVQQAELQIEQARLQKEDVIISQGYDPENMTAVPQAVQATSEVKSGYRLAQNQLAQAGSRLEAARYERSAGVVTAPFDGVVANVAVQAGQIAQPGAPICRVVAVDKMEVEFLVIENDLASFPIGTCLTVIPLARPNAVYEAEVVEINPIVDAQGAVKLRAELRSSEGLFDGMNVDIIK